MRTALSLLATTLLLTAGALPARAADPPEPGRTETGTFGANPYRVYVPASLRPGTTVPLVVMTHGCQTTAEQQQRANRYDLVAERERFIVLYPDVGPAETQQPGPLRNCWQFPLPTSWRRDAGNPAAIAGMTRAVMARLPIDAERVYMVGMSAGAFMTSIMAAAYPELFAAVALNAGGAYADGTCLGVPAGLPVALSAQMARDEMGARARIVPRLVSGGDSDRGIPPACADKALEQGLRTDNLVLGDRQDAPIALRPAAVRTEPARTPGGFASTVSTYRDPDGCVIGERWLIHGMDHFWPGGSSDPALAAFTDPRGPNGAELTWAFLRRYTRSATSLPCAEAPAASVPRCTARWLTVRVPRGARALRATVNGRRAVVRRSTLPGRARVRLPATPRATTSVVVRGRTAAGRPFTRRHRAAGC